MKVRVMHAEYGCDTGCCGHVVEVEDPPKGIPRELSFGFGHPWVKTDVERKAWAIEFARKALAEYECDFNESDLDWENSEVSDD